jgi:hypothetical protein
MGQGPVVGIEAKGGDRPMEPGATPAVTITELEGSLQQIAGVRAVRIVASDDGRIEEVHVLGLPGKAPKQLVRDIESALQALYGISIDRRKISIAQIGVADEPAPEAPAAESEPVDTAAAPETPLGAVPAASATAKSGGLGRGLASLISADPHAGATATSHPRRRYADVHPIGAPAPAEQRIRILGVEVDTDSLTTTVRVRLSAEDADATGSAVGPAGKATVLRLVGEATLKAVEKLEITSGCYAVEDCSIATLGGRGVSVCSIVTVTSEGEQVLSGSAVVRHTAESATARATLDALNRRLGL